MYTAVLQRISRNKASVQFMANYILVRWITTTMNFEDMECCIFSSVILLDYILMEICMIYKNPYSLLQKFAWFARKEVNTYKISCLRLNVNFIVAVVYQKLFIKALVVLSVSSLHQYNYEAV